MTNDDQRLWVIDDEPSPAFPLYTRGNVGEVFPTVVSPLTWSLFGPVVERGWREAYAEMGVALDRDFPPSRMNPRASAAESTSGESKVIVGVFGGYCYLNLS